MWLFERRKFCTRRTAYALTALLLIGLTGRAALEIHPTVVRLTSAASERQIQNALDKLAPHGEVILAEGTYEISQPLFVRHDSETLCGSGNGTVLFLRAHADCPVVILGPRLTDMGSGIAHVRLADLQIDGNRSHQDREYWRSADDGSMFNNNGVQVWKVTDSQVEHVTCGHCRSGGLVSVDARRLVVRDLASFDNRFDGLACYQTEDSRFDGLRLHDNIAAGISLDLSFNHNSITNAVLERNDLGIFMRCARSNSFRGVNISHSRHDGIFMAQMAVPVGHGWQLTPGTECLDNDFENLTINDCNGRAFQVNDASCIGNSISGALFLHNKRGGLGQPPNKPVTVREFAER